MKRGKFLLITAMMLLTGNAMAQGDGQVIPLLPDGVTANINSERKISGNLISGSKWRKKKPRLPKSPASSA